MLKSLLVLTVLLASGTLQAQKREDFIALQRDVAQLQDQMKQLQRSQDEKMAALTALVQQALEASSKVSTSLSTLQTSLSTSLSEQQGRVVAPVAALGTKVDQMSDDFRGVRENVSALSAHLNRLDDKLTDISTAVRTLSAPPAAPPPPATATGGPTPPPGVSAESLYENARRDYSSGKDELALHEFVDYLKYFPETENAPSAQYYIGMIYDRAMQYEDAAKAFDAVLERFPENQRTAESLYMKAVELMKAKQRPEAAAVFKEFLSRYPTNVNAAKAKDHLREPGMSVPPPKPAAKKR
jgi:TolA-binding protein